jgi:hypothetical protein
LPSQEWIKPLNGILKLNWDTALDKSNKLMDVGVVARDCHGAVRTAMCTSVSYITDPSYAGAMAVWKATNFCCDKDFLKVIFEGRSMHVVSALRNSDSS